MMAQITSSPSSFLLWFIVLIASKLIVVATQSAATALDGQHLIVAFIKTVNTAFFSSAFFHNKTTVMSRIQKKLKLKETYRVTLSKF